ncbi:hypothetical protein BSKO_10300 [Bryopsis sp. KO-2023]|nr:hypothetical protein BSKO_10300 [Bryopsis sp. KO-2023]
MLRCPILCASGGGAGAGKTRSNAAVMDRASGKVQLRVCVNKTCKRQGSELVLRFAQDLSIPNLEAESCGCLGQCGNGPNMILLPSETFVRHVSTPADMAEVINRECEVVISEDMLRATELRQMGNALARSGDLKGAEAKFTEALGLGVAESYYLLYSNRSGVRLSLGDREGVLDDALLAVKHSPKGFTTAHIRLIDAHYIRKEFRQAQAALEVLIQKNPEFKRTNDYKLIARQLEKDLHTAA